MLTLILSLIGITGQIVMSRSRLAGATIALCAQPLWVWFAVTSGAQTRGLLLGTCGYTLAAVLGIRRGLADRRARRPSPATRP